MAQPLMKRPLNYALILLLLSLLSYGAIGLCIQVPPAQADTSPTVQAPAQAAPIQGTTFPISPLSLSLLP